MDLLVVGSVALDTVRTPHGQVEDELGGSATYFSLAATEAEEIAIIAVTGSDFPPEHRAMLASAGVDVEGLQSAAGKTFRWSGVYGDDPNDRTTLDTQLNVFAEFRPLLSERHRATQHLFLGNIHPSQQLDVLDQVHSPRLVGCDTMNFWIEGERKALQEVVRRIDVLLINDEEVRLLSGQQNLLRGAREILAMGPQALVVKKGEHGSVLITATGVFVAPALPLEHVVDPTGAGDAFGGAFMARLTKEPTLNDDAYRRAMVQGTAIASLCVEHFGVRGLCKIGAAELKTRVARYLEATRVDFS